MGVALITVQDIEVALGRDVDDTQEQSEWQFYIDTISDFINNYVNVSFERATDVTERLKADYYGQIKLTGPVVEITSVKNARTLQEDQWVDFDSGNNTLYYLEPNQTVLVTYTYGYSTIPDDIQQLVLATVLDQINEISPVSLRAFKVGDVEEQYRDGMLTQLFGMSGRKTLNKYGSNSYTINTGGADQFPDYKSRGFIGEIYGN